MYAKQQQCEWVSKSDNNWKEVICDRFLVQIARFYPCSYKRVHLTCPPLRPGPTDPPMTVSAICVRPVWYREKKKQDLKVLVLWENVWKLKLSHSARCFCTIQGCNLPQQWFVQLARIYRRRSSPLAASYAPQRKDSVEQWAPHNKVQQAVTHNRPYKHTTLVLDPDPPRWCTLGPEIDKA